MRLVLRPLLVLLFLGCLDSFAPTDATWFAPPAVYQSWWAAVESCSGITGDFERVEWYSVPGSTYPCPAYDGQCEGWWRPPHTIYMARDLLTDRRLAEHEMLHDLLQRGDHPPVFQTCGV